MNKLIFIDTNILLDFYRFIKSDITLRYLDTIDKHHNKIITTSQVEMEFKKNRAEEIRKTYGSIAPPNWQSLSSPAILADSEPAMVIDKKKREIETQLKTLRTRVIKLLENPTRNDKVYQTLQRLFKNTTSDINLFRDNKEKHRIRKLALKRFALGYPPRKKDDTSIGDPINWEWIIDCAVRKNADVIIVSRDTDYGQFIQDSSFINDWLSVEFKERVNKQKKITLTNKLSVAFKEAISKQSVTKKMEAAEQEIVIQSQLEKKEQEKNSFEEVRQYTIEEQLLKLREIAKNIKTKRKHKPF
jgi:hypothetical protein